LLFIMIGLKPALILLIPSLNACFKSILTTDIIDTNQAQYLYTLVYSAIKASQPQEPKPRPVTQQLSAATKTATQAASTTVGMFVDTTSKKGPRPATKKLKAVDTKQPQPQAAILPAGIEDPHHRTTITWRFVFENQIHTITYQPEIWHANIIQINPTNFIYWPSAFLLGLIQQKIKGNDALILYIAFKKAARKGVVAAAGKNGILKENGLHVIKQMSLAHYRLWMGNVATAVSQNGNPNKEITLHIPTRLTNN
jgi:hypothetical protein